MNKILDDFTTDTPIKVLLVDDHEAILWGLERLIEQAPRMRVVGKATNHKDALAAFHSIIPDVVVLDLDLNGRSGLELIAEFLKHKGVKVLVSTGLRDIVQENRAIMCGARGVIRKGEPVESILRAIVCVYDGELWLNRTATAG
ncbi:MAG: response regulator transcription factor, partial [Burkholderiales bacterium]|nr:response regulator transcription factor [Burkholderiales bacterium]